MFSLIEIKFWLYKFFFESKIKIEFWLYNFFSFIFSKLFSFFSFIFSKLFSFFDSLNLPFFVNLIIFGFICFIFILLISSRGRLNFRFPKKNLIFSFVLFILLLVFIEFVLNLGGYFYFNIYSNLDASEFEKDAFRILFIGESTTQGGHRPEEAYAAQIETILQQKYPDWKIRSYNKGVGGIETTAILRNLDRNMVKYKPNLVVLMVGWNDNFIMDNHKVSKLKYLCSKFKIYRLMVSLIDFFRLDIDMSVNENFRYVQIRYRTIKNRMGYYSYRPLNFFSQIELNFNSIIQTVRSYDSDIWFVGYLQPDAREKVNPILKKIAKENNIVYIDDYPQVDFKINHSLFIDDGWHPNKEGYKIIAEKIAKTIINEGIINSWQLN